MNAHDIHALSGAYVVDALDDVERTRFEEHLAQCAACRAEVADLVEATTLLAELADTPPPPELRARVLDEIRNVRPLPPVVPAGGAAERRRPRWNRLAAAAAVLAVVTGGALVVEEVRERTSQSESAVDRVLSAADAEGVSVDLPDGTRLRVVRSASEGRAVLITRDLPALPEGKVYELWLQDQAGTMVPAGLLEGAGNQRFLLQGDPREAQAAGITVEPAGGSPQPTSAPLALFDLTRAT